MEPSCLCCRNCGAPLPHVDTSKEFVTCPYCHGINQVADLLQDSDPVRIEKIRARTQAEIEAMRLEEETERMVEREKARSADRSRFRDALWILIPVALIFAAGFYGLVAHTSLEQNAYLAAFIAVVQCILSLVGACMGRPRAKASKKKTTVLLIVLCLVLTIPWAITITNAYGSGDLDPQWQQLQLGAVLPEPSGHRGTVLQDEEDHLEIRIHKQSRKDYDRYVETCREAGFQQEASREDAGYLAYNSQGYKLTLNYWEELEYITAVLDAPQKLETLQWPEPPLGDLVPRPEASLGKLQWCYEDNFSLYVGSFPRETYQAYVEALLAAGYDRSVTRTESSFSAKDPEGILVEADYTGFETMTLYLRLPAEEP